MQLRDKLLAYVSTKLNRLEEERRNIRYNVSMRPMDGFDWYEYMRAEIRIEAWEEFIHDLLKFLL